MCTGTCSELWQAAEAPPDARLGQGSAQDATLQVNPACQTCQHVVKTVFLARRDDDAGVAAHLKWPKCARIAYA